MKRIMMHEIMQHDKVNADSILRELEMVVDRCTSETGGAIQFFTDLRLYGLDEAIVYLRKAKYFRPAENEELVKIQAKIHKALRPRAGVGIDDDRFAGQ